MYPAEMPAYEYVPFLNLLPVEENGPPKSREQKSDMLTQLTSRSSSSSHPISEIKNKNPLFDWDTFIVAFKGPMHTYMYPYLLTTYHYLPTYIYTHNMK